MCKCHLSCVSGEGDYPALEILLLHSSNIMKLCSEHATLTVGLARTVVCTCLFHVEFVTLRK